jgi:hypothetical protein
MTLSQIIAGREFRYIDEGCNEWHGFRDDEKLDHFRLFKVCVGKGGKKCICGGDRYSIMCVRLKPDTKVVAIQKDAR